MGYLWEQSNNEINNAKTTQQQNKSKNKADTSNIPARNIREFTSQKGVIIKLDNWTDKPEISSPFVLTGEVPGSWSFEATFPVVLTDSAKRVIAELPTTIQADWMTTEYVPFSVTLTFESPPLSKEGTLILRKDNPSGLADNDDSVEVPIFFK